MSLEPASTRKIIWAVDPTEKNDAALHHRVRKVLHRWLPRPEIAATIEPVYVLRLSSDVWREDVVQAAEASLALCVRRSKISGLTHPRVLVSQSASVQKAAKLLLQHAEAVGADLVLAPTHGRAGLERLFLGSFAETLVLHARIPLLLVNGRMKIPNQIDHILFPTDFRRQTTSQLRYVFDLAERFHARVTLFHSMETEHEPIAFSSVIGPGFSLIAQRQEWERHFRKRARLWALIADRRGIEFAFELQDESRDVAKDILAYAEHAGVGLIAMESNTGTLGATFIGSVARRVLRGACAPVWIFKTDGRNKKARKHPAPVSRPIEKNSNYTFDR